LRDARKFQSYDSFEIEHRKTKISQHKIVSFNDNDFAARHRNSSNAKQEQNDNSMEPIQSNVSSSVEKLG
jgi:hypothetical protein